MNARFGPCTNATPRWVREGIDTLVDPEQTCLHRLAAGRIIASDLCGTCTARFMAGMDWAAGESLDWHPKYLARTKP